MINNVVIQMVFKMGKQFGVDSYEVWKKNTGHLSFQPCVKYTNQNLHSPFCTGVNLSCPSFQHKYQTSVSLLLVGGAESKTISECWRFLVQGVPKGRQRVGSWNHFVGRRELRLERTHEGGAKSPRPFGNREWAGVLQRLCDDTVKSLTFDIPYV